MITAQDIREKTFDVVRREGYDADLVDAFLDELANEVEAAQKENAVLKSKMKVLVDKIEEYRGSEEAAQRALMSAQKLAIQIESDARSRAANLVADAERQAESRIGSISQSVKEEENRLNAAKAATSKFISAAKEAFNRQMKTLEDIGLGLMPTQPVAPVQPAAPAAPAVEDTVRSIEDTVARLQADKSPKIEIDLGEKKTDKPLGSTQTFTL